MDLNICQSKTDEELVALSLTKPDFFYCLSKRYEARLLRYILKISSLSRPDAEDIFQNTLLKIYTNLNDFDSSLKFSSWAYRITHNETISFIRHRHARPDIGARFTDADFAKIVSALNPAAAASQNLIREKLIAAVSALSPKYRDVIILKFLEDKNYEEISDILKKPVGTVATLISRAKRQLAQIIKI